MMPPPLILLEATSIAFFAGLPVLLIWVLGRFAGLPEAIAIGLLATALLLYKIISAYYERSAERWDGWGRALRLIWVTGPISVVLVLAATVLRCRHFLRGR